jgi:hypothetical protein
MFDSTTYLPALAKQYFSALCLDKKRKTGVSFFQTFPKIKINPQVSCILPQVAVPETAAAATIWMHFFRDAHLRTSA